MKKENTKRSKKVHLIEDDNWINVRNDEIMNKMGLLRFPKRAPRDASVWTKTTYEKRQLKKLHNTCKKEDMHFHISPRKVIRVRCKLIVQLRKNKHFNKTTYSTECWQHEIPEILSKYYTINRKTGFSESIVRKYFWNGKTYGPHDLPFTR